MGDNLKTRAEPGGSTRHSLLSCSVGTLLASWLGAPSTAGSPCRRQWDFRRCSHPGSCWCDRREVPDPPLGWGCCRHRILSSLCSPLRRCILAVVVVFSLSCRDLASIDVFDPLLTCLCHLHHVLAVIAVFMPSSSRSRCCCWPCTSLWAELVDVACRIVWVRWPVVGVDSSGWNSLPRRRVVRESVRTRKEGG